MILATIFIIIAMIAGHILGYWFGYQDGMDKCEHVYCPHQDDNEIQK